MATVDPLPPAPPLLSVFHANPIKIPGGRAEAQARYRARNREAERERARCRMQQLREGRKDEEMERLRRQASSERLRSTCAWFNSFTKGHLTDDHQSSICAVQITCRASFGRRLWGPR
jgi:hypothetical protein